ncbi:hypothetical protein [Roseomonas elaeocarpi]|uniref:Uncharacterized protein n=1 Tax=Roseomonas elaeocarpi TaxID=907779 RepID=A0ABV6JQC7_9PROT
MTLPLSLPAEPQLPPVVAAAVAGLTGRVVGGPDKPMAQWSEAERERAMVLAPADLSQLTPADRREAEIGADRFAALLRPATVAEILAWLMPINAGVRNVQGEEDLRIASTAIAMLEIPAATLTVAAQRDALRTWQFFPSAADVAKLLEPVAMRWRRQMAACQEVARGAVTTGTPLPNPWPRATPEEARNAAAQVAELKRSLGERPGVAGRPERMTVACPLAPHHLIAAYEQTVARGGEGAERARARLAILRRQHASEARA